MEIIPVGGYGEIGRNMTCVKVGEDSIIIDMGIRLDRVLIHEDTDISKIPYQELISRGIIPDYKLVKGKVKAIVVTHGHLDHVGALTFLAEKFPGAPVIGTPYTIELVRKEVTANPLQTLEEGETLQVAKDITIEFVRVTHSIPQSVILVLHTREGKLVYANDFKFDDFPVLGKKTDYKRLRELGKEGVRALIVETLRVHNEGRTPPEKIARDLLASDLVKAENDKGLLVTTFSSHIARIYSIVELAKKIGRTPFLLGRSMEKYVSIAEQIGIVKLDGVHIYGSPDAIVRMLKKVRKEGKDKYLLVVTGHQGEPDALLTKIANKAMPLKIEKEDQVIFSAEVIPNPINEANRYSLETKLKMQGARIFKGAHVSGHASKEDHRDLLKILQPENIVPCHGDMRLNAEYVELADSCGYTLNKDIFLLRNGQGVEI
ncbi:MAG: ribonuclease J [Thermoplasmata archaeon]|nr:MAG: ribonuclease J [Thermoplasmata archaeon]